MVAAGGTNYLDGLSSNVDKAHTIPSNQQTDDNDELWLRILQEVSNKNNTAVHGSLIILGIIFYFNFLF